MFFSILRLELLQKTRDFHSVALPAVFLLCFIVLFPLALTPEASILRMLSSGICWLALIVSLMLYLDRIFRQDYEQGSLDAFLSSALGAYNAIVARLLVHWLIIGLPCCFLATLGGFFIGVDNLARLLVALFFGSANLVFLGAVVSSLCVGLSRSTILVGILLLPLLTPIIIFGVHASSENGNWSLLVMLFGLACINLVISVFLCKAALQATIE